MFSSGFKSFLYRESEIKTPYKKDNISFVTNAAFHWARKLVFPNSYFRVGSRGARRIRVSHLKIRLPTSIGIGADQRGHIDWTQLNSTQLKFIENGSRMAKRIQNTVHKNKSNDKCELTLKKNNKTNDKTVQ